MHSTYDLLKDFAGPVAAIVGAFAASIVAFSLGRAQWRIAASQRDIALINSNLISFIAAMRSIKQLRKFLNTCLLLTSQKSDSAKIRVLYIKIDEACFYFPPANLLGLEQHQRLL
jgi:hypothetical protein